MHFTALPVSICCIGVHDAYALSIEDTVTLPCVCHMRVAVGEVLLKHTVTRFYVDCPHLIVLWICSVYCIAVRPHTVDARSLQWPYGCGASSAGRGC